MALPCCLSAIGLSLVGCLTPEQAREQADKQVYEIIREMRDDLVESETFTIEPIEAPLRERLLLGSAQPEPLELPDCLEVGAENSRDYQTQREDLYLVALDLTLARWDFSIQETGTFGAFLNKTAVGEDTAEGTGTLGFSKLFTTGLTIVGDLTFGVARDISRGDFWEAFSSANLAVTQPLLRGFGSDVVREPLTQAERNVVYQARSYDRFRRTFAFDVASRYFSILEQQDVLRNEQQNEVSRRLLRERNESFAVAGRLDDIQVDQARQDELSARNRVIAAERSLEAQRDNFKFFLGLPIQGEILLNPGDLLSIEAWDQFADQLPEDVVIEVALQERLDYQTTLDEIADAKRRVVVAADGLRTGLDIGADFSGRTEDGKPFRYTNDSINGQFFAEVDLPLDRFQERNVYRESLIAVDRAERAAVEAADAIERDLRDLLRALEEARRTYEIQTQSVLLAERRVESSELQLDAGRVETRDVLESQDALIEAQNLATSALTTYILSGLALYRDMELVRVTEAGVEIDTAPLVERLSEDTP